MIAFPIDNEEKTMTKQKTFFETHGRHKNMRPGQTPAQPSMTTVLTANLDAMADNVADIARFGAAIKNSRLKENAILTLLKDMTGMSKTDISRVLDALPKLEKHYLK